MPDVNNKKLSLFVAWLNILVTIALPVYSFVKHCLAHKDDESPQYFYSGLPFVIIVAVLVSPWLIASISLLKGIKENRPKFMAPWIYLGYLLVILSLGGIIYVTFTIAVFKGSLKRSLVETWPMIICWAILVLCIIPVRNLHQRMSIPPPLYYTQVVMVSQMPTQVAPSYMPVVENVEVKEKI